MYNFISELSRSFSELKKYKFNIFFANLQIFIIFYGLTEYIFVDDKNVMFFMLLIWYFASHGVSNPTYIVEEEIMDRTIFSIFQSKTSLLSVIVQRSIITVLMDTIKAIFLFTAYYFFGNFEISIFKDFHLTLITILIAIITSYALGIIIAALALVFKRITNFISLTYYYLLFFAGPTVDISNSLLRNINKLIFPYINARNIISAILEESFVFYDMGLIFIQAIVFVIFSSIFFKFMLNRSLIRGDLYGI